MPVARGLATGLVLAMLSSCASAGSAAAAHRTVLPAAISGAYDFGLS